MNVIAGLRFSAMTLGMLASALVHAQTTVGRTAGEATVTATGAARYTIPLALPPGTNGLAPDLAIIYDSRSGNGPLGVGFRLSGLSAIRRCGSTHAQDGTTAAVVLNAGDRLCLDGQRLRATSGTYGQSGSQYQTEVETFTRVTAIGIAGTGPASFRAEARDGLIYEYGTTTDSRIEGSYGAMTVREWALNRVRDRAGNYIDFKYVEDAANGSYRPLRIDYAGNMATGALPYYSVRFTYESRPAGEVPTRYLATDLIREPLRLDRIDVMHVATGRPVRSYDLAYGTPGPTGSSRIASVRECAGSACLAPTTFAWSSAQPGWGASLAVSLTAEQHAAAIPGDMNGDGFDDLAYFDTTARRWKILPGNQLGLQQSSIDTGLGADSDHSHVLSADIDGNGRRDLLVPGSGGYWHWLRQTGANAYAYTSTGIPNVAPSGGLIAADMDGDGRDDLVYVKAAGDTIYWRRNETAGGTARFAAEAVLMALNASLRMPGAPFVDSAQTFRSIVRQGDMNGDGRVDLLMRMLAQYDYCDGYSGCGSAWVGYWYVLAWNGTALAPQYGLDGNAEPVLGDFNADGLTDIAYTSYGQNWQILFGMGSRMVESMALSAPQATGATAPGTAGRTLVIDWDADGRMDIVQPGSSGEHLYCKSNGASLETCRPAGTSFAGSLGSPKVMDVNGDGVPDVTYAGSGVRLALHQQGPVDLLATVTDGFGVRASFEFAPLADPSVHLAGTGAVFPVREHVKSGYIVSKMRHSDATGGTYQKQYFYEGAKTHVLGRGFLGFARRTVTDTRSPLVTVEDYLQDPTAFDRVGAVAKVTLQQQSGSPVTRSAFTWGSHAYSSGYQGRRFPYVSGVVTDRFELDGTKVSTHVVTGAFDTYGTLTGRTTTSVEVGKGLSPGAQHVERVTFGGIVNDAANWCLGRPSSTQITRHHSQPGGAQVTRSFADSWDYLRCRQTQHVVEPASTAHLVTTNLTYDSYGNVNALTVTPVGQAARTTSYGWIQNGRFLGSRTNPVGHVTSSAWDSATSTVTSAVDGNGLTTRLAYDEFGRLTRRANPDGTSTTLARNTCGAGCASPLARYVTIATQRGLGDAYIATSETGFDAQDREVHAKWERPGGATSLLVRQFDARGQLARESIPGPCCATPGHWVTYEYDTLGRMVVQQRPTSQSNLTPAITRWRHDGLAVTKTDALGRTSTRHFDVAGNVVTVVDPGAADTDYEYDAFGNLTKVRDFYGTETSATYDVRGFRTGLTDPDAGRSAYTYFPTGEVKTQANARGQVTSFTYDRLSRPIQRAEPEGVTTWTWGTSSTSRNIGALAAVASPGFLESYQYDSYGRPASVSTNIAGATLVSRFAYDTVSGLLDTFTYPPSTGATPLRVRQHYDRGQLVRLSDADTAATYWQLNSVNALGLVTDETLGNGVRIASNYDAVTGLPSSRASGIGGGSSHQNLGFAWDAVGNLTSREERNRGVYEQFAYDSRDRLDYAQRGGAVAIDLSYDEIGNVTYKSDVGNYRYDTTRKHAVVAAGSNSYSYDASGAVVNANGTTINWLSYDLPSQLTHPAGNYSALYYGPDRRRYRQVARAAGSLIDTLYAVGGLYERVTRDGAVSHRHYIVADGRRVAVQTRAGSAAPATVYLLEDHLGGVDGFTSASGQLLTKNSYTPFGARRSGDWTSNAPTSAEWQQIQAATARGFTDHEHLDNLGIIHMNGRVFDPALGRFLSPDPIVPDPYDSQGLNRYSYVWNNPLRYTDPSGFCGNGHPAADNKTMECFRGQLEEVLVQASALDSMRLDWLVSGANAAAMWAGQAEAGQWLPDQLSVQSGLPASEPNASLGPGSSLEEVVVTASLILRPAAVTTTPLLPSLWSDILSAASLRGMAMFGATAVIASGLAVPSDISDTSDLTDDRGEPRHVYHFTNDIGKRGIGASGSIRPGASGLVYVSRIPYLTAAQAQSALALPRSPTGYFSIPRQNIQSPLTWTLVQPNFGQTGGGMEATVPGSVALTGAQWFSIGP